MKLVSFLVTATSFQDSDVNLLAPEFYI